MRSPTAPRATVWFFGGNGHCAWRLNAARAALAHRPGAPALYDVPYPGFEGRPRAESPSVFLQAVAHACRQAAPAPSVAMATGIGALIALALRSAGALLVPLILQGPVLWGLEHRMFPRIMRWRAARELLHTLFMRSCFQARFCHRYFRSPLALPDRRKFFEGYARCAAFEDFFAWFGPAWLRTLEGRLAARPAALERVTVWLGGRDAVIGRGEVAATERALGVRWPVVEFADWGHYPMIDVPEEWADALCAAVAPA